MEFIKTYLLLLISSALLQNIAFGRGIGITSVLYFSRQRGSRLLYGTLLTVFTALSSLACYALRAPLDATGMQAYLYPLVFVAVTIAIYVIIYFCVGIFLPRIFEKIGAMLPACAFSCVTMGALLLTAYQKLDLPQTLVFALGTGIGYMLAVWLIEEGRRRLDIARLPAPFRGLPITLIYIGIISMALFGFIGNHALPY